MHNVEPCQVNVCYECNNNRHKLCDGQARFWRFIRRCDCNCRKMNTIMSNKFLLIAATAGCISASSISSRLSYLDKYTDQAVFIRDKKCRDKPSTSVCGLSEACLMRSAFAAVSCKSANDAAATRQPPDVQLANDKSCKSDLSLAESACKQMESSNGIHEDVKDAGNDGIPGSVGGASDAGARREGND